MKTLAVTEKATVTLCEGTRIVYKTYTTMNAIERAQRDRMILSHLHRLFPQSMCDGWKLGCARLADVPTCPEAVAMEYLPGETLEELPAPKLREAEFLYGVWIGLYVRHVMAGNAEGPIYSDVNLQNAIVDWKEKTFTVIDPGAAWGKSGSVYDDVAQHITSVVVHCIRNKISPIGPLIEFSRGLRSQISTTIAPRGVLAASLHEYARNCRRMRNRPWYARVMAVVSGLVQVPGTAGALVLMLAKRNRCCRRF